MSNSYEKMNSWLAVRNFQREIIHVSTMKLGRKLTAKEKQFVTSRRGFIALAISFGIGRTVAWTF